jgi:hypothetical protein
MRSYAYSTSWNSFRYWSRDAALVGNIFGFSRVVPQAEPAVDLDPLTEWPNG